MANRSPPERIDNVEDGGAVPEALSPMDRFRIVTKRLVRVGRAEVGESERAEQDRQAGEAKGD